MRNFWAQNDKRKAQNFLYKQLPATKILRRKNDHEKLKEQVAKQKKEIKDGITYGKDNKADLGGNMVSTCVCAGCPGKKKHKTATSKECVWHNKFVDVNNKQIPDMLQRFAAKYSPKGHLDVADLLLESLATRGTMLLVDATTILEMNQQSDVNGNANNLARSLVDEIASGVDSTCESHGIVSTSKKIITNSNSTMSENTSTDVANFLCAPCAPVANLPTEIPKQTHNEFSTRVSAHSNISTDENENSISQVVQCIEFLDSIELNHDPNDDNGHDDIDLDAIEDYIENLNI